MKDNISDILKDLNKNEGVQGSIIMTKEGIVITSDLNKDCDGDLLAAISSSLYLSIQNTLSQLNTEFSRYTMTTEEDKLILVDLGKSILIVLTKKDISTSEINLAIFQASTLMKKSGRIDI